MPNREASGRDPGPRQSERCYLRADTQARRFPPVWRRTPTRAGDPTLTRKAHPRRVRAGISSTPQRQKAGCYHRFVFEKTTRQFSETDLAMMRRALLAAEEAAGKGEVPVGAVIAREGKTLAV